MRKIILIALFLASLTAYSQSTTPTIGQVFNTISDLKKQVGSPNVVVYVTGGSTTQDFRGAFYVWDEASVTTEDMTYFNYIQVTGVSTGRWVRTNQSSVPLPQGMLFRIGPLKILSVSGVTNANGKFVMNATLDNTANGTAIFNSILFNSTTATSPSANAADAVNGSMESVSNGKVITYKYTKGTAIGLLGAVSVVFAPANIPVQCFVVGL